MAMMARMRSLAPAFILSIGVLFVLFMVISDSNVMQALGGRSNDVGSVNGDKISYQEFASDVDKELENMKSKSDKDVDAEQMPQIRDQVWNAVVTQKLVSQEIEKFGITVSDDEIRDIILGDNPPDFLKQNFIDSTGKFNRQLYESSLFNPQNSKPLIQAEEYVRQQRLNEKLQSLLFASITVSDADIKRKFIDQNISMDVEYALVGLNLFPDSTMKITDDDLKTYYNNHSDDYKVRAQRKLKYVLFPEKATDGDSLNVKDMLLLLGSGTVLLVREAAGSLGRDYYWLKGGPPTATPDHETDLSALAKGKVALTPLDYNMTRQAVLAEMEHWQFRLNNGK